MIIKKSIRSALSIFLLLCFSVAALPLDFLHNHEAEQIGCNNYPDGNSCNHKVHVSKKDSFCFACTIHFDKTFTFSHAAQAYVQQSFIKLFVHSNVPAYVAETLLSFLRGPPSLIV